MTDVNTMSTLLTINTGVIIKAKPKLTSKRYNCNVFIFIRNKMIIYSQSIMWIWNLVAPNNLLRRYAYFYMPL